MNKRPVISFVFTLIFCFFSFVLPAQFNSAPFAFEAPIKITTPVEYITTETTFDSPYQLHLKKEAAILSVGLGLQIAGLKVLSDIKPLTVAEIDVLEHTKIRAFDRRTVFKFSARAHNTSDIFLFGSMSFPFLLMADKNIRKDYLKIGVMGIEAFLLNGSITTLTKGLVQRTRPYAYNPIVPVEEKINKTTKTSFFSGHTSQVAVVSFFSAKIFADYHPDSKWKPVVWTVAAVIPATTGYLRYAAGKHFPTDVIVGYGVGALIGVLIPHLHRTKGKQRSFNLSPMSQSDAIGLTLRGVF